MGIVAFEDGGVDSKRDIYGTADPYEIARVVDRFCTAHLGAPIAASLFYRVEPGQRVRRCARRRAVGRRQGAYTRVGVPSRAATGRPWRLR